MEGSPGTINTWYGRACLSLCVRLCVCVCGIQIKTQVKCPGHWTSSLSTTPPTVIDRTACPYTTLADRQLGEHALPPLANTPTPRTYTRRLLPDDSFQASSQALATGLAERQASKFRSSPFESLFKHAVSRVPNSAVFRLYVHPPSLSLLIPPSLPPLLCRSSSPSPGGK